MSYLVERRLSSAIADLQAALEHLVQKDVEVAQGEVAEALRKVRHARDAVKGTQLECQ